MLLPHFCFLSLDLLLEQAHTLDYVGAAVAATQLSTPFKDGVHFLGGAVILQVFKFHAKLLLGLSLNLLILLHQCLHLVREALLQERITLIHALDKLFHAPLHVTWLEHTGRAVPFWDDLVELEVARVVSGVGASRHLLT